MLKKFVRLFGGDPQKKVIEKYADIVDQVNELEAQFEELDDEALQAKTAEFRARLAQGETLDEILAEAFAAVREVSKRTLGQRHYDVQIIGGTALHQGTIIEMRTGEGKTLVATLPIYLNALAGRGVHLITVNDYLARRDARWMAPIYHLLGLSVGVLQMAARTENGKKAFLVDLERESPHEDQHQLRMVPRQEAYAADITYGTNSEFGFDYLRDNMTYRMSDRVQRGHSYAIIDEVDNVLIDEARTPLIISGPAQDDTEWYVRMAQVVKRLKAEDYEINEHDRTITLTEIGEAHVEELLEMPLRDPDRPEDVTPEQARLMGYLEQALRAQFLFKRNKDYLVQGGKVVIIDEFTGRLMPGRRWSDGLHQAVEAKEGARVQAENITYATVTIQNYFRMYDKLAGMTGTAVTEAEEFHKIYNLEVIAIPTNLEYQAAQNDSDLVQMEGKDEGGYKYIYYAQKDPNSKTMLNEGIPVFWKRKDFPDVIYRTEEAKFRSITQEILTYHAMGRPMLVGTTSVELSDRLSSRLRAEPIRRLAQVLLVRDAWLEKNHMEMDGRQIPELQLLNTPLERLQTSELRKIATESELSLNPEDPKNLDRLQKILGLSEVDQSRLLAALKAGIAHEVLNARKHTEESQIIAGAGAFGAVTIATNMAGRGVDIKLGGELAEEVLSSVNRVLRRAGYDDAFDMQMEDRRVALLAMNPSEYGIYESEIQFFLQHMEDMAQVKRLGGLHVIGSERHEARRIDNQLRGRAARQGDPGSSRFYLSMEDELMRRFGGQQANDLMQRLKIDDALPLEMGIVSRLVEQSQTRVEGANFDVRKHLLEYDDVLNAQRQRIYEQRNRIFVKNDLSEDVTEMLRTEVKRRVPEALKDEEGPWKLLAWLEGIQPALQVEDPMGGGSIFPSYTYRLLLDHLNAQPGAVENPLNTLLSIADNAMRAEEQHLLNTLQSLLINTRDRMESQLRERMDALDTFFEGLDLGTDEEEGNTRSPRELTDALSGLMRMPVRLSPEQQRALVKTTDRDGREEVAEELRAQLETAVATQAVARVIGAMERRLDESLELPQGEFRMEDWDGLAEQIMDAMEGMLGKRRQRLIGDGTEGTGQIGRDLESILERLEKPLRPQDWLGMLISTTQGARALYDKRTHRRMLLRTTRLVYVYYAASLIDQLTPEEITEAVLEHLEQAQAAIRRHWGMAEWERLSGARPEELDEPMQENLRRVLGDDLYAQVKSQLLQSLDENNALIVKDELGRRALTEVYRPLLLSVITDLWVDYLTQMEALRVSIGLEAYAQRDPLVQYKSRASQLFQELFSNMRLGVVNRMFTFRPRVSSGAQVGSRRSRDAEAIPDEMEYESLPAADDGQEEIGQVSDQVSSQIDADEPLMESAAEDEEEAAEPVQPDSPAEKRKTRQSFQRESGKLTKSQKRRRGRR